MSDLIETDYLVVGAGAAGMTVTDALLAHGDASVTLVDRRHAPGGHWLDAYPFVRLHQPSAFYGVDSVPLGRDAIDRGGLNAGFHELAGADELRAYFSHVMQEHFLPTGRVRFLPCTDYMGDEGNRHHVVSRLTGARQEVRVRRKLVDTTYLEGSIPATSKPPFEVDEGVHCIPAGEVVRLPERTRSFVVIGAGKTALDTCVWLLTHGVPAASIRWVKPRESWWLNRRFHQPHAGLPDFYAGVGLQFQAMAQATTLDDLFLRLEAAGFLLRVDPTVMPTMFRGAILSEAELALLRQVADVVRQGRVHRIGRNRMTLDNGEVETPPGAVHVHCAAACLASPPLRPIFEPGRLTVQPTVWGFASFQFALLGAAEALVDGDEDKNRLCRPISYWDQPGDYIKAFTALLTSERARAAHPALAAWARDSRLNPLARLGEYSDHPTVVETRGLLKKVGAGVMENMARLMAPCK
ncbi:MAG: NAD(P)-binding protein [Pseudomonadota bacterium]|nr:NAD(P)-binding protein [Pseudomonadota bacterium]